MRLFTWNAWGNISIYKADTVEEIQSIYSLLKNAIEDHGCEELIEKADNLPVGYRNPSKAPDIAIMKKIDYLVAEFGWDTHEVFQHGTKFNELLDPITELNSDN